MVASGSFDNTGNPYNVSRIINGDTTFNLAAYKAYSPLFISVTFAMSYGLSFASVTAALTYTIIYHGKKILNQARSLLSEQPDIHARLMSAYKGVPDWWYLSLFCASMGIRDLGCTRTNAFLKCPCSCSVPSPSRSGILISLSGLSSSLSPFVRSNSRVRV